MTVLSNEEILQAIAQKPVMDVVKLIEMMEKEFNVSAAAAAVAMPMMAAAAAAVEEKTHFTVKMTSFGENKVNVIKAVRGITGLGLKEAKDLVESAPCAVKEGVSKEDAEKFKKELEEAGAKVELA